VALLVLLPLPGRRLNPDAGKLLCDTIEVIPRVASIDLDQMDHALTRHFGAMNRLSQELNLPEEICGQIAEGVISLIHNAAVEGIEGGDYR
jgi:hypothetical protein